MKKIFVGLGILFCMFGVGFGVMIKTNPELNSLYHKYRDLLVNDSQQVSLTTGNRSTMTGWDEVLKTVDVEHLTQEAADALLYGFFPTCENPSQWYDEILISDHVKNCTQKKKQGRMFD